MTWRTQAAIFIFLALNATGFAWTDGAWPAATVDDRHHIGSDGYLAKDYWQMDCYSALVEHISIVARDGGAPPALHFWRFEHDMCAGLKATLQSWVSASNYADLGKAEGGSFDSWFASTWPANQGVIPTFSTTSLAVYINAPTDFFDKTPWRSLAQSPYGWDNLKKAIQACRWVPTNGYWYATKWSFWSSAAGSIPSNESACEYLISILQVESNEWDGAMLCKPVAPPYAPVASWGWQCGYQQHCSMCENAGESEPAVDYFDTLSWYTEASCDVYAGSLANGSDGCGDDPTGPYIGPTQYMDGVRSTHLKSTQSSTGGLFLEEVWFGDCADYETPLCNTNAPGGARGGWSGYGPYFVIKYDTGLRYQ